MPLGQLKRQTATGWLDRILALGQAPGQLKRQIAIETTEERDSHWLAENISALAQLTRQMGTGTNKETDGH